MRGGAGAGASTSSARAGLGFWRYSLSPLSLSLSKAANCLGLPLLLAACTPASDAAPEATQERIACALGGAAEFSENCELERTAVEGAEVLVVRHPDGGFRRLEVSKDGQNLLAADGADVTQSARKGDRWEVVLGEHRYVIPVKADAPRE
jgi:hypothetical protein